MKDLKFISPFKKMCITIGNLPTAYIESMSYYEGLTFLVNYLANNVIPVVNNNSEVTKEIQAKFAELENYVSTYFENLDVQEEINNKLDDMADSGQLTDIIAQYLGLAGMITFDTVADMKLAENLVDGSKCCTLGYGAVNDKGNALYKIREILNTDVIDEKSIIALYDNTLVAELINTGVNNVKVFDDDIAYGIEHSEILYLNGGTYNETITAQVNKDKIKIYGNGSTINIDSNLSIIFDLSNAYVENAKFIESNVSDKTKNHLFTGYNITFKDCYLESTVGFNGALDNITFDNCELKDYYRDIYHGSGKVNNFKVLNCKFSRKENYSSPYEGDSKILIYNFEGTTDPLDEDMLDYHGNNIEIKNCEFNDTNKRQIHIFNVNNVEIENNIFNASGLDSSSVGGSDDLVSLDFVNYYKVNNNYFGPSGENDLDILSSSYGEIKNNKFEKPYDYYVIDINYSDYIRSFGENLTDKTLMKSKDSWICNNDIVDSNSHTINLTPSDSIHIYNNKIVNSTHQDIILLNDFGGHSDTDPSGQTITNLDLGPNNVTSTLGNFGRCVLRTNYEHVISDDSGHLSEDICWVESQSVNANTMVYCQPKFPCMHGDAGKLTQSGLYRSVSPSLTTWDSGNSKSVRRGIDFITNRYNSGPRNTLFYPGDILDKYPISYVPSAEGNWDNTQTSGTIYFKSW